MAGRLSKLSPTYWVTAQNIFKQGFSIALFAIQAPMLGPRAFGLFALVMVFVFFCEQVMEVASTEALVSVKEIDEQHYATMTTVNVLFALALGVLLFLSAGLIAAGFREPELEPILHFVAALPLFTVLSAAPSASCRRDLRFQPLAQRMLASTVGGGVVGLVLTFMHFGVWALVWQATVHRLLNVAIIWKLVDMRFRLGFSARHFRELRRYATPMLLTQCMSWSGEQVPRYILGAFLGASDLGLYSLAARLADLVTQLFIAPRYTVARIEMRQFIDQHAGIDVPVRRVLLQISALTFPVCICATALMPLVFNTWLNARWAGGIIPAQLMMLGMMPFVTHYALSAALLGTNRQSAIAINATVQTLTLIPVTVAFAPFGLYAVTAAIACRPLVTATIPMYYARRYCGLRPTWVVLAQLPILLAAVCAGAVIWGLYLLLVPYSNAVALLAWLAIAGSGTYFAMLAWLVPEVAAQFTSRLPALRWR
jgi:O-antigen/teichoic acid export membrane protein